MKKPWYQIFLSSFGWIVVSFLFIGSILDTISNAIGLITPAVTYTGTALLFCTFLVAMILLKHSHIRWITTDGQSVHLTSLGRKQYFLLVGILGALWLPRLINTNTNIPHNRSRVELISVTPEAGTQLSYADLQAGIPIFVVVKTTIQPPYDWEKEGLVAGLSLETLRLTHEDGSTDWDLLDSKKASSEPSRVGLSGVLHPSAVYEGRISVMIKLAFYNAKVGKNLSGYDSRVRIEYLVSGVP